MSAIVRPIMRKVQAGMFGKTVKEIKAEKGGVMSAVSCVLSDDMLTVKEESKRILSAKTRGTPFESRVICCNLTNGKMPHGGNKSFKGLPMITSGNGERYIANLTKNTIANYKYFDLSQTKSITVCLRGKGKMQIAVNDKPCGEIRINSAAWQKQTVALKGLPHSVLMFKIIGGKLDILSFELMT